MLNKSTFFAILFLLLIPYPCMPMETQEVLYTKINNAIQNNDFDAITKYMESYPDINYIAADGCSVPHWGFTRNPVIIPLMLKYQADINIKSTRGLAVPMTPLMASVYNVISGKQKLENIAHILQANPNIDIKSGFIPPVTPFEMAINNYEAHPEIAHIFIDYLRKRVAELEAELAEKDLIEEKLFFPIKSFQKLVTDPHFRKLAKRWKYANEDEDSVRGKFLAAADGPFDHRWQDEHKELWPIIQNSFTFGRK